MVSLGPGDLECLTPEARKALENARVVIGYRLYLELIAPLLRDQEVIPSGMMTEVARCQTAIERARQGQRVALVSGGDAGIYGMAGLVLELAAAQGLCVGKKGDGDKVDFFLEVIPGIPALAAGAALLGAPLMHDFACISLSDLLTPWELIEKRVKAAAAGDFVVVLYNPRSKKRHWQLARVVELLLELRDPSTPVGIVRQARRPGEEVILTTLEKLPQADVDMLSLVIVGNSQSFRFGNHLITPRGYLTKYPRGEAPRNQGQPLPAAPDPKG